MWIVTEGGLARVDASQDVLPPDCRDWGWHAPWLSSPALADFWSRDSRVRLAVDQLPTDDRATVWLVKLFSNRVLRLDWR